MKYKNMSEFVQAGGADCAAAWWRYQQGESEEKAKVKPETIDKAAEEATKKAEEEDPGEGWDL